MPGGRLPEHLAVYPNGGGLAAGSGTRIGAQIAVSLALIVGAGLFLKTLANLRAVDVGSSLEQVLLFRMDSTRQGYAPEESVALYARIGDRVRALPGARAVTMAQTALLGGRVWMNPGHVEEQSGAGRGGT